MGRGEARPRGRPTWVSGTKHAFLSQYSSDWQSATDTNVVAAGKFYTKVTKRFIKKYGWGFDRWTDKDCPDPNPATIDDDDSQDGLTEDEIAKRQQYFRDMRAVSIFCSVWQLEVELAHMTYNGIVVVYNGVVPFSPFQSRTYWNRR